jgi:hypothetical protein
MNWEIYGYRSHIFATIDLFGPIFVVIKTELWIIKTSEHFIPDDSISMLYFLFTFSRSNQLLFYYGYWWSPCTHEEN